MARRFVQRETANPGGSVRYSNRAVRSRDRQVFEIYPLLKLTTTPRIFRAEKPRLYAWVLAGAPPCSWQKTLAAEKGGGERLRTVEWRSCGTCPLTTWVRRPCAKSSANRKLLSPLIGG